MSDKIKDNLEQIVEYLKEAAQKGAEFAQEQTPILIDEILTYYSIVYGVYVGVGVILMFISYKMVRRAIRKYNEIEEKNSDMEDEAGKVLVPSFAALVLGISGIITFFKYIAIFIKVTMAPRLFLLDYILENYL